MQVCMHERTQRNGALAQPSDGFPCTEISVLSLYISVSPMIGGDGLFSFNSKLAVLVSEPDVQIKKVRHAHLILVNLPLHISPACQLLCDSNHHRHMPLLCAPLWVPPLYSAVVVFLPGLKSTVCVSLWVLIVKTKTVLSFQKKKKMMKAMLVREGHLICSSTFRRMLNMAADDELWDGPRAAGVSRLLGSVGNYI